MIVRLKKEIQALKDEITLLTGEQRAAELTPDELLRLEEQLCSFVADPDSSLDVGADMRKIQQCFIFFKKIVHEKRLDSSAAPPDIPVERPAASAARPEEVKKLRDLLQQRDNEINILVSMLKREKSRNQDPSCESAALQPNTEYAKAGLQSPATPDTRTSALHRNTGEQMSLGRQEAYDIFKRDYPGKVSIEDNKALLKQRFAEAKSLGQEVNNARQRISEYMAVCD
ncbi:Belongs to the TRAFAC class myosin-kinesin ATPase superfamily. Kinesin family, partial [Pristimantis euphronides]